MAERNSSSPIQSRRPRTAASGREDPFLEAAKAAVPDPVTRSHVRRAAELIQTKEPASGKVKLTPKWPGQMSITTGELLMASALGIYRATVVSTEDPEASGRVLLTITRTVKGSPAQAQGWASVGAAPLGPSVTAMPIYSPGDSVLYVAERLPFDGAVVLCSAGSRASGSSSPEWSATVSLGQNNQAIVEATGGALHIRTTAGHQISLQPDGSASVMTSGKISLSAADVEVAAATVTIDAGISKFSGVLQCETLIANSVVANSYSPGVGNVW